MCTSSNAAATLEWAWRRGERILFLPDQHLGRNTAYALGVPMAYLGAFVFGLPVYFVYLCAMSEEATRWILGIRRYLSRKWINNLTVHVEGLDVETASGD